MALLGLKARKGAPIYRQPTAADDTSRSWQTHRSVRRRSPHPCVKDEADTIVAYVDTIFRRQPSTVDGKRSLVLTRDGFAVGSSAMQRYIAKNSIRRP
jgi:hypothetical protein